MGFRDNLIYLRTQNNLTQEQIAMLVGVSRQSVTKWEADKSYPEMDKLIKLCEAFGCTLDDLVTGDLSGSYTSACAKIPSMGSNTAVDLFGYDEFMRSFASKVSNGVMAIIFGVALCVLILGGVDENANALTLDSLLTTLGVMALFAGVAIGLALIIPAGIAHSAFHKKHPYIEDFYTDAERDKTRKLFSNQLVGGIVIIFCGIVIAAASILFPLPESLFAGLMLICIGFGVKLIIHGGIMLGRTNIEEYNNASGEEMTQAEIQAADVPDDIRERMLHTHNQDKRIGAICGTIMIIATIVGLTLLFVSQACHQDDLAAVFWLPWPIGGLLCGIVSLMIKGFGKQE